MEPACDLTCRIGKHLRWGFGPAQRANRSPEEEPVTDAFGDALQQRRAKEEPVTDAFGDVPADCPG